MNGLKKFVLFLLFFLGAYSSFAMEGEKHNGRGDGYRERPGYHRGGWDRPGRGGWDRPGHGGWGRPNRGGWDRPGRGPGRYDHWRPYRGRWGGGRW